MRISDKQATAALAGMGDVAMCEYFVPGPLDGSLWTPRVWPSSIELTPGAPFRVATSLPMPDFLIVHGVRLAVVSPIELGEFVRFSLSLGSAGSEVCRLFAVDRGSVTFPVLDEYIKSHEMVRFELEFGGATPSVRVVASVIAWKGSAIR